MKVLLIGAEGMLGHDLADVFTDVDLTALGPDDLDITDADAVATTVKKAAPEIIINAAAYTAVDDAETNQEVAFKVNSDGVRNIAQAAKDSNATMIHYSTDYVFPGTNNTGYAEDDPPGSAVNVYGESKLAGEQALAEVGPRFFLLRTAWLYGHHGKNFVETMLKLAQDHDTLTVVDDQHGSPTYTRDVARTTRAILEGGYEPAIYHAVNAGTATWYDFAKKIFELADKKVEVQPVPSTEYPRPAKRPAWSILKNTRGPELPAWEDALADYLAVVK